MQVEEITLAPARARELYRAYKTHRYYSTPIDRECQRAYQLIAQGKMVIRAIESIKRAGLDDQGRPRLAIARATADRAFWFPNHDRTGGRLSSNDDSWRSRVSDLTFPQGTWPAPKQSGWRSQAEMPVIPIDLRPRRGLANYHVLWEAEWGPMPPVDPFLLRRIGRADLWLVVAAWELTAVEQAAMATRIPVRR